MPKYLATVRQELEVKITAHAANEEIARKKAEEIVLRFSRTTKARTTAIKEL